MKVLENYCILKSQQKDINEKIEKIYWTVENGDYEELASAPTFQEAKARLKELKRIDKNEGIDEELSIIKHIETKTKLYSIY